MIWGKFGAKSLRFIKTPILRDPRISILEGSVRSSKTVTMIPKWIDYILNGPPGRLAMTGVTKQTLKGNVLDDLFDTVGEKNYNYNRSTGELVIYGRKIQVIGAKDEGSEKYLRGPTFAGAYCDEVSIMPQTSFAQLLNRLSVPNAKLYATTNPDSPYHWLNVEYVSNEERKRSGMVKVIHFVLDDNPNLTEEYKAFIRNAYSGLLKKRMVDGLWVLAEGAIYDMYDSARVEITAAELPEAFHRRIIGIDYGAGNPTVFLKFGIITDQYGRNHYWQYDEWYHDAKKQGNRTNAQLKRSLIEFIGDERIDAVFMDPSALSFLIELEAGDNPGETGPALKFIYHAANQVLSGINSVGTMLEQGRLHIVKERCPETLREYGSYIWDPNAQKLGEDAPLKQNDHCMDSSRYAIYSNEMGLGRSEEWQDLDKLGVAV